MANYVYDLVGLPLLFSRPRRKLKSQDLLVGGDGPVSTKSGHPIPRAGFIKSVSASVEDLSDVTFQVVRNDTAAVLYSLTLSNEKIKVVDQLYVAVPAGVSLGCKMVVNSGKVSFPVVNVEWV